MSVISVQPNQLPYVIQGDPFTRTTPTLTYTDVSVVSISKWSKVLKGAFILEWLYKGCSLKISDGSANWSSPLLFCQNIQKRVPFFKKSTHFLILKAIHIHCRIQKKVNATGNNPSKKWPLLSRSAYSSRFFPVNMFTCIYIYPYIAYTDTHKYLNLVSLPKKFITFCFIKLYVMFLSLPLSTFQYHHCIVFHHLYLP